MPTYQVKASLTSDAVAKLKKQDPTKYAKLPDAGTGDIHIDYPVGETVADLVKNFTEKVVRNQFLGHLKFTIQGKMRTRLVDLLAEGKSLQQAVAQIQSEFFANNEYKWKPSDSPARQSAVEKEKKRISNLDPEKKAAEIAAIKKMLAELQG